MREQRRGVSTQAAIGRIGVYVQALTERGPPTALPQPALSELVEAFRAGDGVDLIRDSVRVAMQELIELEATERFGTADNEGLQADWPSRGVVSRQSQGLLLRPQAEERVRCT